MMKTNYRGLIGIFAFCLVTMSSMITMTLMSSILANYPDVSETVAKSLMTMPSLVAMIFAFLIGTLNKKFSTKSIVLFAQGCLVVHCMIFLFFGGRAPIRIMLLAACLAGFTTGANFTLLAAFLAYVIPDETRRTAYTGYGNAVINMSGILFSAVVGKLADMGLKTDPVFGWTKGYTIGFFVLICMIICFVTLPGGQYARNDSAHKNNTEKRKLPSIVYAISVHYLLYNVFMYCFGLNIALYISKHNLGGNSVSGIAMSMITVGGIAAGLLYGSYSRITKTMNVPIMMSVSAVALLLVGCVTHNPASALVGGFLNGFANGACSPYIMMLFSRICPPNQMTQAMSVYSGCMNVGMFTAMYVIDALSAVLFGSGDILNQKFILSGIMCGILAVVGIFIYKSAAKAYETTQNN